MTGHFLPPPVKHFLGFLKFFFSPQTPGNPTVLRGWSFTPTSWLEVFHLIRPSFPSPAAASTKPPWAPEPPSFNSLLLYLEAAALRNIPKQRIPLCSSIPHLLLLCLRILWILSCLTMQYCPIFFAASPSCLIFKPPPEQQQQKNSGAVKRTPGIPTSMGTHGLENTRTSPRTHPGMLNKKK